MAIASSSRRFSPTSIRRCATNGYNIYVYGKARAEEKTVAAARTSAKIEAVRQMERAWMDAFMLDCPCKCRRGDCSWSDWKDHGSGIAYTRPTRHPDGRISVGCTVREVLRHYCDCDRKDLRSAKIKSLRGKIFKKRNAIRKTILTFEKSQKRSEATLSNSIKKDLRVLTLALRKEKTNLER